MKSISSLLALLGITSWTLFGTPAEPAPPLEVATAAPIEVREPSPEPQEQDAEELLRRAEERYGEGSYSLARRLYEEAASLELTEEQRRWVRFRTADAGWRAAAASAQADTTDLDRASRALRELVAEVEREEEKDRIWALARESLGHFHWDRPGSQDWGSAWPYYQAALEWWAGSSELDEARRHYLDIVYAATQPTWYRENWGRYTYTYLPLQVLENAVEVAVDQADLARAHFLLGTYYANQGRNLQLRGRVEREFGAVIELGKESGWYDDALYQLGNFLENHGKAERGEDGQWRWEPDFVAAVELYRRLLREFHEGETSWYDDAESRIRQIVEPNLWISVDQFFLPGSRIPYHLGWRNATQVELSLYRVDLTQDVRFDQRDPSGWLESIRLERLAPELSWVHETGDAGDHRPGQELLALEDELTSGAFVLEASARGKRARTLVLVSDVTLTTKAVGGKTLAWLTEVNSGEPVDGASVRLWQYWWEDGAWRWRDRAGETGDDGTLLFDFGSVPSHSQLFVAAVDGARQAFVQGGSSANPGASHQWRVYAFTDRSTYRPGHEVSWKLIARRHDGHDYSTPGGARLDWELYDPLGSKVSEGEAELDAFGTAASTFATEAEMPLGEYRVQFYHDRARHGREYVGDATLFRLEEYKRPEFEVTVEVPDEPEGSGRPRLHRVGERVEFDVVAEYYFGGAVAEANVEVFVWQKPYYHSWKEEHEFPWYYEDTGHYWWGGHGQQVSHQVLETDADGRCRVAFDTPIDAGNDLEYTIEARVVDSSRREITGSGTVRVTRTAYFAKVEVEHAIHRPSASVELAFRTADANGNGVEVEGEVQVTRERWVEIWRDPSGRKVHGQELDRMRATRGFPPPGWSAYQRGYEREVVASTTLRTNADGRAEWEFTPDRDGYYRVAWSSVDSFGSDIAAETNVFVADENTRELGYLPGGIDILVDQSTLEVGQTTPVLLLAPASGRWVLFTVEGEDLMHHEVLKLDGTVKLVQLEIVEAYVPNVQLGAISVHGGTAYQDLEQLIVPPARRFLDVEIAHGREAYLPGEQGTVTVTVHDRDGNPVEVDVALAVVDDSLAYIQGDYAGDPRKFFYGQKRQILVQTRGTVHHGTFRRVIEDKNGFRDERQVRFDGGEGDDEAFFDQDGKPERRLARAQEGKRGRMAGLASNAPAAAPMVAEESVMDSLGQDFEAGSVGGKDGDGGPAVRVRSDFRETALWLASVRTDEEGQATVTVPFPDSTTRWSTTVRAADTEARFGIGNAKIRTRQPLIARLQAPRFFVVGDEVTISGNLNNGTASDLRVRASLEAEGLELLGRIEDGRLIAAVADGIQVPAEGQLRLDWRVRVTSPGEAKLSLKAIGEELGDAIERTYPVYAHGIEALVARSGRFDADEVAFSIELPAERAPGTTSLSVQVTPSIAVTMLDALPYLIDYPYGCTEQTLSRFVPTVIVARTLREQGLSPEDAVARAFGGIEREHVDKTHPDGPQALDRLDDMVQRGLERLYDFQHADGGWAWWKTGDSDPFMTAYVLWGLSLARDAGVEVRAGVLENGARWLVKNLVEAENEPNLQAWELHALAVYGGETGDARSRGWMERAFENLWDRKDHLNAYGRALFALSAHEMGRTRQAGILADNLIDGASIDDTPDTSIVQVGGGQSGEHVMTTAHWGDDGIHHRWYDASVEATAFSLRALVAIAPDHELVEPTMAWLVKNRRAAQWSNTRDTAICVLALNDYLAASGELAGPVGFEVLVNGQQIASRELAIEELLRAPSEFEVDVDLLRAGENEVRVRRTRGEGPLYFAAYATFLSQEEPIPARGNEVFVRREYYKLVGRPTLLRGFVYDRVPLEDGDDVRSGERIEVVVTAEAKNDLEYLVFEDLKPAGFEAVQVRSGEPAHVRELKRGEAEVRFDAGGEEARTGASRGAHERSVHEPGYTGRSRAVHQELRDRKVAFFVDRMPDGLWELRYDLRAETPGSFHALPLLAHAMYVPEIRANGREIRVTVLDSER